MPKEQNQNRLLFLVVVAVLGWTIPGLGYAVVKEYRRAVVCFLGITLLFVVGLYVGSIGVIDNINAKPWYAGQLLTSPFVTFIANATKTGQYQSYGKPQEIGQIYTTIAGLLNLLCIISATYMAYYGRTELIGEEEQIG